MSAKRPALIIATLTLLSAAPSFARPGGWGAPGWGGSAWGASRMDPWGDERLASRSSSRDEREGKVDAASFAAADAQKLLGKGVITVSASPGTSTGASEQAAYEAALIDQLVKAGYDTTTPNPSGGQRAEIRIVRDVLVPEEQKRNPVSGAMSVGTGSYGSSVGMAIALDFSKPRKALLSTRVEVRIIDKATDKPLWEGRAEIATREGDSHWNETAIATRLAAAMFAQFPAGSERTVASR